VPTQTLPDHLGVEISTASATCWINVSHRRCQEISRSVKDILYRSVTSARRVPSDLLRSFLGKVSSIGVTCDQARFRLRTLHDRHDQCGSHSLHPRSCNFTRSAVVVRISLLHTRQRCAAVAFSTNSSNLDGREFRARVRIDSAGASSGAKDIRDVVVLTRKAPVTYYHEGARRRPERHSALYQRLAWTYGVPLRRQPGSSGDHQESHVLFPTVDERVESLDVIAGTTRAWCLDIYISAASSTRPTSFQD
jgi:hypothetical protein